MGITIETEVGCVRMDINFPFLKYFKIKGIKMIIDTIENISIYKKDAAWLKAVKFLKNIKNDTEDGEYEIDGSDIFARVMTYDTKNIDEAYPEAHKKYIDIQVVLSGKERVFWYPLEGLQIRTAYDKKQDVAFYEKKSNVSSTSILTPGHFMVFFPEDGHMPSISIDKSACEVKKIVIKIAVECIGN